jgi:hypothetical protein
MADLPLIKQQKQQNPCGCRNKTDRVAEFLCDGDA